MITSKQITFHSKPKKSIRITVIAFCTLLVLALVQYIINSSKEANIADAIYTKTGFTAGSADNVIIRKFFYLDKDADYTENMKYDYTIINGMLFAVSYKNGEYGWGVFRQNPDKTFSDSDNYERSILLSGKYMRADIDKLFSEIRVVKNSSEYAFSLLIDSRDYKEIKDDYVFEIDSSNYDDKTKEDFKTPEVLKFIIDNSDLTFADPEKIELSDENGAPIDRIELNDGKYVAFCGTISSGYKEYKVIVSYEGKTYTLLTYDDIVSFRIRS